MRELERVGRSIILFMFLASCSPIYVTKQEPIATQQEPAQTISNTELLKSAGCSLPCWSGIEVDKTNFQLAKEKLTEKYGIENVVVSDGKSLEWKAQGLEGVHSGYISFFEGTAGEVYVFFESNAGISVENLIRVLGEPTSVFVSSQPHDLCRGFDIVYPTLGVRGFIESSGDQKDIQPVDKIFILQFLQIELSENMQIFDGYLVKWSGYKSYCE